ncbi:MAG TPA: Uma2 family endonuclease [Acidimicrobiales bacterium]|nr:Uma2 family endonuclease [Acidimicrobiales bacterium]
MAVQEVWPAPHRFTIDEYHRMADAGLFGEDDRIELLDGEIVEMAPIGSRHAGCVNKLTRLVVRAAEGRGVVAVQNPILVPDHSEPQPDLALLRPRSDDYAGSHALPADVLLVVEVADTTVAWDRRRKVPLYAAASLAEVWLVDLPAGVVEVFREPRDGAYAAVTTAGPGDVLTPLGLPGAQLRVDEILT